MVSLCVRKPRVQQINEYLMQNVKTVYRLRKVFYDASEGKEHHAYVVSLAKVYELSLQAQVENFYAACIQVLNEGETLLTEDRYFKIISETFELSYCLEAWKKNANKICYVQDGAVQIELLHRRSCEQAAKLYKKKGISPLQAIAASTQLKEIKNPADRYVALCKKLIY